ncbi:DoxX family protein [Fulvivirga sp. M361]|uniref:BT_3928 family protein n=1 Tax=Fulvivirga sp. M361 TaxID=2594266 RepID=UPI00117BD088|nr:BT_3928 family protein [Fulvivirga sp. M361]TRX55556.1 DoxX family protein [Fulvivirga sp. M361]
MFRKIVDLFSRVFVGGLFIFSGLIKLNDPVGTKIKLQDYFQVFSNDFSTLFEWFIPAALPLGFVIIILEVVLGVSVLLFYKMEWTTKVLLGLMVFFSFLTFYSAYFNKVTDCGCFGDAIPLTPWQSFYKDVILMVFILHLFWYRKKYSGLFRSLPSTAIIVGTTLICFIVGKYAVDHLPFIDFRPYKIGNNIPANMIAKESPVLEYTFMKDGEEVTSTKYYSPDQGYEYVSSKILNEKASTPKITDYQVIGTDGDDYTEQTFQGDKLILVFYTAEADNETAEQLSALISSVSAETMMLTSSSEADFENFRHEHQLAAPFFFTDATVLKAMIRSDPGVMLLRNGTVLGKWHYHDIPSAREISELLG